MIGKRMILGWKNPSLHQLRFGCDEGELRPGSSGGIYVNTEAIDFLSVWSGAGKG